MYICLMLYDAITSLISLKYIDMQELQLASISSFYPHFPHFYLSHLLKTRRSIMISERALNAYCDMIKGNESLVENVNVYFLTPLSYNFEMLHFDANPITIGYLVTEL